MMGGILKRIEAINVLKKLDSSGRYVFTKHDLAKFFPDDSRKTFSESLARLVKDGLLIRACRGIYVNENAKSFDPYTLERVAIVLRRGEYNYVSLETILSEYGVISQVVLDRLTLMTTGRSGVYNTPYGIVEFTHTKRTVITILNSTKVVDGRPLRIATKDSALRDLKRVGRNISLINLDVS